MYISHHVGIGIGYSVAIAATFLIALFWKPNRRALYPAVDATQFARPWIEFLLAILACIAILAIGQVYQQVWRVPNTGSLGWLGESVNQLIIFAPIVGLLVLRRNPPKSVFLTHDRALLRLGIGIAAGLLGTLAYGLARLGPGDLGALAHAFLNLDNIPHLIQVLGEDLVIIALIVRLAAGIKSFTWAGLIIIFLFVAGHIPALFAAEALTTEQWLSLLLDCAIGILVLIGLLRTRDLLWFWPVHVCMDLTQFVALSAGT